MGSAPIGAPFGGYCIDDKIVDAHKLGAMKNFLYPQLSTTLRQIERNHCHGAAPTLFGQTIINAPNNPPPTQRNRTEPQ
jgi:hypothetical protein